MGRVAERRRVYRAQMLRVILTKAVLTSVGLTALVIAVALATLLGRSGWGALSQGKGVLVLDGLALLFLGGALAGALALSFVVGRRLVLRSAAPLLMVEKGARALAEGRFETRIELPERAGALSRALATHLNGLANSLERTDQARREMVANLAHELRTPLTNVQGYLEALRDGVIEANESSLGSLHEEVLRLVRLVDGIHQLARVDSVRVRMPTVQETDLDRLAGEILALMAPTSEARGLRIRTDWGAGGRKIPVHADSMAQVLRNLLRNAITYADEGGTVVVQTSLIDGVYRFSCLNTGPGIATEDLPHIFKRFYRAATSAQVNNSGVGVGLAIVRELVEAHGGRIGVESKQGWTNFWIELPEVRQGAAS
jgi:signal transduction histidine kinase